MGPPADHRLRMLRAEYPDGNTPGGRRRAKDCQRSQHEVCPLVETGAASVADVDEPEHQVEVRRTSQVTRFPTGRAHSGRSRTTVQNTTPPAVTTASASVLRERFLIRNRPTMASPVVATMTAHARNGDGSRRGDAGRDPSRNRPVGHFVGHWVGTHQVLDGADKFMKT
jgi:hypothetical protein